MVDYIFTRKIFKVREMAFSSLKDIGKKKCDVVYLHSNDKESLSRDAGVYAQMQYTLVNDLRDSIDNTLSKVNKNCRYEIRRAEKEGAVVSVYTDLEEMMKLKILENFELTYNDLFKAKGISMSFNRNLVLEGVKANQLVITCCEIDTYQGDKIYHAYLVDGTASVLMYSASPLWIEGDKEKANCIGRMNKYLHWKDIEYFKTKGYETYEWGGISSPDNPNGIDKFKGEFGGEVVSYCNYLVPCSLLGKVYTYLARRKHA